MDFFPVFDTLEFEPQDSVPQCISIAVVVEDALEIEETFTVQLNTSEPDVAILSPSSSTVTISNDDRKKSDYRWS